MSEPERKAKLNNEEDNRELRNINIMNDLEKRELVFS